MLVDMLSKAQSKTTYVKQKLESKLKRNSSWKQ